MLLHCDSSELNMHSIHLEWHLTSNYAPLTVTIPIVEKYIANRKRSITKNSKEEEEFIKKVITAFSKLDMSNISDVPKLEEAILAFANIVDYSWMKHLKLTNITKHSKSWWNKECNKDLVAYRSSRSLESWKTFQKTIKNTKREFFNLKIQEIANEKQGPWELMNWVNKCKLPAIKMIKYNGQSCLKLDDL